MACVSEGLKCEEPEALPEDTKPTKDVTYAIDRLEETGAEKESARHTYEVGKEVATNHYKGQQTDI